MAERPGLATARIHFPDGRNSIVVLEEIPAPGRALIGPLRGRWICESVSRAKRQSEPPIDYDVWPRLDE